jgi:mannose-6-phosphate isomerase
MTHPTPEPTPLPAASSGPGNTDARGPVALAPNLIEHYYRGGDRIARLRGITTTSDRNPEEWLGATVTRAGEAAIGLARTQDGDVLRDLVLADPGAWVGPGYEGVDEGDVGVLVKLLDARQRLPVHVHPDRAFAASHLGCSYGKTEAWFILETEPGSAVYLGWNTDVDSAELTRARDEQDSAWMLSHMNRIEVEPGMGILVPAGTAHAIDDGIFLAEVQEPTDFSILLEWSVTTSTREESHLGIGFDAVMPAVSTARLGSGEIESLVARSDLGARLASAASMLPAAADPFFTLVHAAPEQGTLNAIPAGFSVVLVLAGNATLAGAGSGRNVSAGEVFAVPHAFGDWTVEGDASILVAAPGLGWPQSLRGRTSHDG